MLVFFALVSFAGRAMRRRAQRAAEQQQAEYERAVEAGQVEPGAGSPFGLFPFGGMLEELMRAQGMSRSYTIDPETGEWVEITDQEPEVPAEPGRTPEAATGGSRAERRADAKRRRRASSGRSTRSQEPLLDARRHGRDAERRQRRVRGAVAGRADDLRRRRRHGHAEAGGARHGRPHARAPGRRRALRDRVERDPAARPTGGRQDLLRGGGRGRVRAELHPRLDGRSRRLARRRLCAQHREGLRRPRSSTYRACSSSTSSTRWRSGATTRPTRSPAAR